MHALGAEHALDLAAPDGRRCRRRSRRCAKSTGSNVLGRWCCGQLNSMPPRDPRAGQPDERRLDHAIVVDEVVVVGLVERHLHAAAELGQHHDLQVAVLEEDGRARCAVGLVVRDVIDDGIGVHRAAAALVDPLLQEQRVRVRRGYRVRRQDEGLLPDSHRIAHAPILRRRAGGGNDGIRRSGWIIRRSECAKRRATGSVGSGWWCCRARSCGPAERTRCCAACARPMPGSSRVRKDT